MKKAILLIFILLWSSMIISKGEITRQLYGYYESAMYTNYVVKQSQDNWCTFAAIASHPDVKMLECQLATMYVTRYGVIADCCDISQIRNYTKCVRDMSIGISDACELAQAVGVHTSGICPLESFFEGVARHEFRFFPYLMFIADRNPGHTGLCVGLQFLVQSSQILGVVLVWANPATGTVIQEYLGYNFLLDTEIYFMAY